MHHRVHSLTRYIAAVGIGVEVFEGARWLRDQRRPTGQIRELLAAQARLTGVQERLAETQHNLAEAQRRLAEAQATLTANQRATATEVNKLRDVYPYAEGKDPWEPPKEE